MYGVAPYRLASEGRPGLIFGYATLSERAITTGIEILARVIAAQRASG